MSARYEDKPQVEFLPDGRNVKLLAPFVFYDPTEIRWYVKAGAEVDGASIPRFLWSIIGGPFEGKYRDASIIHDWYCDTRERTWQATHRVFYDAMYVSGVHHNTALIMYYGVRSGGPRWTERVTTNVNLWFNDVTRDFLYRPHTYYTTTVEIPAPAAEFDERTQIELFTQMKDEIEQGRYSLPEIDTLTEQLQPSSATDGSQSYSFTNRRLLEIHFVEVLYAYSPTPISENDMLYKLYKYGKSLNPPMTDREINEFFGEKTDYRTFYGRTS